MRSTESHPNAGETHVDSMHGLFSRFVIHGLSVLPQLEKNGDCSLLSTRLSQFPPTSCINVLQDSKRRSNLPLQAAEPICFLLQPSREGGRCRPNTAVVSNQLFQVILSTVSLTSLQTRSFLRLECASFFRGFVARNLLV